MTDEETAIYNKGWKDACSAVSDSVTVRTLAGPNLARLDSSVFSQQVMRVRSIVTLVSRWKS